MPYCLSNKSSPCDASKMALIKLLFMHQIPVSFWSFLCQKSQFLSGVLAAA